jgi:hypothetical protein
MIKSNCVLGPLPAFLFFGDTGRVGLHKALKMERSDEAESNFEKNVIKRGKEA